MKLIYLILFLAFISWNNSKKEIAEKEIEKKMQTTNQNDEIFLGKIVIILSEELEGKSSVINIQDYIEKEKSFIPVF